MRRRHSNIPLRRPIFVGCEGKSEQSYVKFLSTLLRDEKIPVHLDAHVLLEGDPLARTQAALTKIIHNERRGVKYHNRFLLLDSDQIALTHDRSQSAIAMCKQNKITIVWQKPDHEGLLCRHFDGLGQIQILNKADAMRNLKGVWRDYEKNLVAIKLEKTLTREHVARAAAQEPDFRVFIESIGLI